MQMFQVDVLSEACAFFLPNQKVGYINISYYKINNDYLF